MMLLKAVNIQTFRYAHSVMYLTILITVYNKLKGKPMRPTLEILRTISSPYVQDTKMFLEPKNLMKAYLYSKKNKMSLLFLDHVKDIDRHTDIKQFHNKEVEDYQRMLEVVTKISHLLGRKKINYAIFKTLRPYRSATVDVDVLIFGDKSTYLTSVETIKKAGCKRIVYGPRSTTLLDQETNIRIDLYEQVAVNFVIYMDKEKLANQITVIKLSNGECIKTLKPEADLATIIAHSIVKEQLYTLSEYYTFIHYLKRMDISDFIQIVKQNNITTATRIHTALTALLHKVAHKTVPEKLQQILDYLGREKLETSRLEKGGFETPHKYHPITIINSLMEIAKGQETRRSMADQLIHLLYPRISKDFLRRLIDHLLRETY